MNEVHASGRKRKDRAESCEASARSFRNERASASRPSLDMVVVLCGALLQVSNMFAKIVPNPTGTNGYEEYVRAAEIASVPDFAAYSRWIMNTHPAGVSLEEDKPIGVDLNDPDLTVRRKWIEKFRMCSNLISAGNRKPVYEPRDSILPETTFPEMAMFRALARLQASTAHVSFADGNTGEAVMRLEEGITFGQKLGGSILISRLVGVACGSIALAELDDHWPQLSLNDAHELRSYLGTRISATPLIVEALKSEKRASKNAIDELFAKPDAFANDYWNADKDKALINSVSKLSPLDAANAASDATAAVYAAYDSVIQLLSGPESEWLKYKDSNEDDTRKPLSGRIAGLVLPTLSQVLIVEARERTRLRLAYLTASAIEYRWINGRLPSNIEEFTSKPERLDPTSGRYFVYKRDGSWFKITREAKDALGGVGIGQSPKAPDPDVAPIRA